ncbi:MAG: hypothetical protein GY769_17675 [bacterium]|nr:hypothetical protein [bacterium]
MSMNLYKASNQWATRPADERFGSLVEMGRACASYHVTAEEKSLAYADLRVQAHGGELIVPPGPEDAPARLSNWAFGQLVGLAVPRGSGRVASYLRGLPATLAAQNLNYGLKVRAEVPVPESRSMAQLLVHKGNGGTILRAVTSTNYTRFWNWELVDRIQGLDGWLVPPAYAACADERNHPATEEELAPFGDTTIIKPGDMIGPAGLYASDHDCFIFQVRPDRTIQAGPGRYLSRGAFFWNSEVGDKSLGVQTFLYDFTCGNHIVWDAEDVHELRISHVGGMGRIGEFFFDVDERLLDFSDEAVDETEAKLLTARTKRIAGSKEGVLDALFGKVDISKRMLDAAYDVCESHEDGDPMTYWGMTAGLTRLSQTERFADRRVYIDREAGKVLKMAF